MVANCTLLAVTLCKVITMLNIHAIFNMHTSCATGEIYTMAIYIFVPILNTVLWNSPLINIVAVIVVNGILFLGTWKKIANSKPTTGK